jgi:hypothetical protein
MVSPCPARTQGLRGGLFLGFLPGKDFVELLAPMLAPESLSQGGVSKCLPGSALLVLSMWHPSWTYLSAHQDSSSRRAMF